MSRIRPFRGLAATLLVGSALATPAVASGPMHGYAPIGSPSGGYAQQATQASQATQAKPAFQPTFHASGRDRVSLDRNRVGAQVGDSLLRLAPTTNNGRFSQFENYQGSISATTRVDGDNYGTIVTNQNGNILGLIGNNGVVDASAGIGVETKGDSKAAKSGGGQ
ncbi:MAG: hypothetical protein GY723_00185 [bacterium]|nr:hypothetical protein [bacterium]